jgi:hypothetical protein
MAQQKITRASVADEIRFQMNLSDLEQRSAFFEGRAPHGAKLL